MPLAPRANDAPSPQAACRPGATPQPPADGDEDAERGQRPGRVAHGSGDGVEDGGHGGRWDAPARRGHPQKDPTPDDARREGPCSERHGEPRPQHAPCPPSGHGDAGHQESERHPGEQDAQRVGYRIHGGEEEEPVSLGDDHHAVHGGDRGGQPEPLVGESLLDLLDDRTEIDAQSARLVQDESAVLVQGGG